ncbi:hypothetical protein [Streptomyces inhibens]|uniref:hypothetical protein n=1 Tax=Streptomyces inhibens TaxID=2293571 RepID=UPI000FFBB18E|nr:hypothetical protein [Streptomyces inhibens]
MNNLQTEVHLALSGRITFEQGISVAQAAQVIGMLHSPAATEHPVPRPEPPSLLPSAPLEAEEEPREAPALEAAPRPRRVEGPRQSLEFSGAKTIAEKMTAFAAYLTQEEGHETFTQSDIKRLFQRSRERIPSHFSREFDRAVRAGWIHEGSVKGEHYLGDAAKDVLGSKFDGLRIKRGSKRDGSSYAAQASGKRKPRSVPTPEAFADLDQIPSEMEGIMPYHRVKKKRDKLLWALKLAKVLGIGGLQNSEATWLTDKLGDALPTRDMNGHFTGLRRVGFANRSMTDNSMRITDAGEEYLESL